MIIIIISIFLLTLELQKVLEEEEFENGVDF